ncbi:MAG: gliding motility-associated C-terminal domain-containing protein [Bacteroidales bacterium]|nr:gliding motility-associated C-terminal domain-containing protein [Bacteroidales bacterium]
MKLLLDKFFLTTKKCIAISLFFCSAILTHAEEIDPTDVSYVSVNPYTNEVSVCWYKSESANIKNSRILYIYDETTLIKGKGIVDIPGNEDNTFLFKTDTISLFSFEANEKPISLAVDAYSENGNNSTSLREYHTTMVSSAQITKCPSKIKISWTKYVGFGITVDKYEIIETQNGKEIVLKECSNNENNCLIELNENKERNFFVRATFTDCRGIKRQSTSCMCDVSEKAPVYPQFIEIANISIEKNNDISLVCKYDLASDFRKYIIYKSKTDTLHFIGIDTINLQPTNSPYYNFSDKSAYIQDTAAYYKTAVFDNCNEKVKESYIVTPIQLHLRNGDDLTNIIEWSQNSPWISVGQYRIWRSENYDIEQIIDSVEEFHYIYIDDLDNNFENNFSMCYRVEAIQNSESESFASSTNTVCLNKEYKLLIPNAFNPYSNIQENKIFKPKYAFITGEYKMEIFDRFGGCVFSTSDINSGWDGTIKGKIAPTGTYQYKIKINLPNGEKIEKFGVVNLIFQ